MSADPNDLLRTLERGGFAKEAKNILSGELSHEQAHVLFLGIVFSGRAPATPFPARLVLQICATAFLRWGLATGVPIAAGPPGASYTVQACEPEGCLCIGCELRRLSEIGLFGFAEMLREAEDKSEAILRIRLLCRALPALNKEMAEIRERAGAILERLAVQAGIDLEQRATAEEGAMP